MVAPFCVPLSLIALSQSSASSILASNFRYPIYPLVPPSPFHSYLCRGNSRLAAMHASHQSVEKEAHWSSSQCLGPPPVNSDWWDRNAFAGAVVVRVTEDGASKPYRMYYYGRSGDMWNLGVTPFNAMLPTGRIGMALSEDGVSFERFRGPFEGGAVMDPSNEPEAFDCVHIGVSDVAFSVEDKRWRLYYFGGSLDELPMVGSPDLRCKGLLMQPGVAFSEDGVTFKEREGPILRVGDPGSWDQNGVTWPRVLPPDSNDGRVLGRKWLMSYHSRESEGPNSFGFGSTGIAVSDDGITWEKKGKVLSKGMPGAWDEGGVTVRHIIRYAGQYIMLYEGFNYKFEFSIGLAVSEDGFLWNKDTECGPEPGGPVLRPRKGEDVWDNLLVATPYVIVMPNGSLRMYYLGRGKREGETTSKQGIGVAVTDGSDFRVWKRYKE